MTYDTAISVPQLAPAPKPSAAASRGAAGPSAARAERCPRLRIARAERCPRLAPLLAQGGHNGDHCHERDEHVREVGVEAARLKPFDCPDHQEHGADGGPVHDFLY